MPSRTHRVRSLMVVLGLLGVAGPSPARAAGPPVQVCAAAKLKASGKKLAAAMKCWAKAKMLATAVDPECLTKAHAKFALSIAKAGAACAGTATTLGPSIDACVTALLPEVPGTGKCPSKSAGAAGKAGSGSYLCRSKAVTKPGIPFLICTDKVRLTIGLKLAAAGNCANGDPILATLASCVAAVADVVDPIPTTTTTMAPPATTTTTLAGAAGTCGNPIDIPANGGTVTGSTSGAGTQTGSCTIGASGERVYRWVPNASGVATITTCDAATNFDTVVYVRANTCTANTEIACDDDNPACGFSSEITPTVTAGVPYFIVVDGFDGRVGNFRLTVSQPMAVCGNGQIEAPEACDSIGQPCAGGGICRADCSCSACGDGIIDEGEQCDGVGTECGEHGLCRTDCSCAECGDGTLDLGEECDFAGIDCTDGNGCTVGCTCKSIVVLDDSVVDLQQTATDLATAYSLTNVELRSPLKQFSARIPAASRPLMANDPLVRMTQKVRVAFDVIKNCTNVTPHSDTRELQRIYAPQAPGGTLSTGEPLDGMGWGTPVGVAVLDTGIERGRGDLFVAGGFNAVRTGLATYDGDWDDDDGHGTEMAGIIAARNSPFVQGVAPMVNLYAVRIFRKGASDDDADARGARWVLDNRADIQVVNGSFGTEMGACADGSPCYRDSDCGRCVGGDNDSLTCPALPLCPGGTCSPENKCLGGQDAFLPCAPPPADPCPNGTCVADTCTPMLLPTCSASSPLARGYCISGPHPRQACERSSDCDEPGDPDACQLADPNRELWCELVDAGITFVAAAGNRPLPAGWETPANYEEVIAVGGLTDADGSPGGLGCAPDCQPVYQGPDDSLWPYSANTSPPVDILAPAVCVPTIEPGSVYALSGGTSSATAFVSGAAALYIQAHRGATPQEVAAALELGAAYDSPSTPILNNTMPDVGVVRLCSFSDVDPNNCGACGNVCPAESPACVDGACTWCPSWMTCVGDGIEASVYSYRNEANPTHSCIILPQETDDPSLIWPGPGDACGPYATDPQCSDAHQVAGGTPHYYHSDLPGRSDSSCTCPCGTTKCLVGYEADQSGLCLDPILTWECLTGSCPLVP